MLRTVSEQPTLWESVLPAEVLRMPAELEAVDRLLDDERFFAPYRQFFHATFGRPSIPIETYLRLMFLKYRYRLGFEPLCREVADSISWSRFCSDPAGRSGAAPDDVDEDHDPLRRAGDQRPERGVARQGGRGEGAQDEPGAGGHDGDRSERRVPVGLVVCWRRAISRMAATAKKLRGFGYATRTRLRGPDPFGA